MGTLNPAVAAAKTGGRAPIQALRASTAAALVNSLLPSSASHLPLPYAPSPADGGWCRVETAPAPFKSPYHTQKVGQEGVHLPHSAQNLPLLCKALSKSQKEAVGLTCWEAFIGLGTNFPSSVLEQITHFPPCLGMLVLSELVSTCFCCCQSATVVCKHRQMTGHDSQITDNSTCQD